MDLGASSGRVIRVELAPGRLDASEIHRFRNRPRRVHGTLSWDFAAIEQGVATGLARAGRLDGIGIDSWAVDYGLLDADGTLLGDPVSYRDERTEPIPALIHQRIAAERLYAATGIQHQPFNTLFQLAAEQYEQYEHGERVTSPAPRVLLIPDLLSYRLTGVAGTEITNASTTGLLDPRTRAWSKEVAEAAGIDLGRFAPLREPGVFAGDAERYSAPVFTVGSHDTASAVAGVPASGPGFAYISCGTWSLVGVELDAPVLSEDSRAANFTNELGIDGTVRYLRNVSGLWLLQECLREWGAEHELPALLDAAARCPARRSVIDATDPRFLAPGGMPERIAEACRDAGQPVPAGKAEMVRCILDSLAEAYRRAVEEAATLSGREVGIVHLVGGGARNALLCQLTADAVGLPVVAGPVEAAALGNALVQARAAGVLGGGLAELRALIAETQPLRRFEPGARLYKSGATPREPGGTLGKSGATLGKFGVTPSEPGATPCA